jgi:hypothetical protein
MGDRNNVKITYGTGDSVYLYSHWGGSQLEGIVQRVIERTTRLSDESYLARAIFSAMVADDIEGELGYGIAPYPPDQDAGNKMIHIDYNARDTTSGVPQIDWAYGGEE